MPKDIIEKGLTNLEKELILLVEQDNQVFPTLDDLIDNEEPDWEWLSDVARGR
tara:strand:+ start:3062 stop:3220 length:159 start_codon:yes stop_codon:yes gene_type:complete